FGGRRGSPPPSPRRGEGARRAGEGVARRSAHWVRHSYLGRASIDEYFPFDRGWTSPRGDPRSGGVCRSRRPEIPWEVRHPRGPDVSLGPHPVSFSTDAAPVRCLKNGLWFLQQGEGRFVVLLAPVGQYGHVTGVQFQIATVNNPAGTRITQAFFQHLEDSVLKAESYRGKILSLEQSEH